MVFKGFMCELMIFTHYGIKIATLNIGGTTILRNRVM